MKRTSLVTRKNAAAAATAVAAFALAGCSTMSPQTTIEPYDAADGVSAEFSDGTVALRNMLVVSAEEGAPGVVLGSIVNRSDRATTVSLMAAVPDGGNPAESRVRLPAGAVVQLDAAKTPIVIESVPGAPGGIISISAETPGGGSVEVSAPIVPQTGYYASYTAPAATPVATPSATPTPSGTGVPAGGQNTDGDLSDEGAEEDPSASASASATP